MADYMPSAWIPVPISPSTNKERSICVSPVWSMATRWLVIAKSCDLDGCGDASELLLYEPNKRAKVSILCLSQLPCFGSCRLHSHAINYIQI